MPVAPCPQAVVAEGFGVVPRWLCIFCLGRAEMAWGLSGRSEKMVKNGIEEKKALDLASQSL
jgi:hypothetical protein